MSADEVRLSRQTGCAHQEFSLFSRSLAPPPQQPSHKHRLTAQASENNDNRPARLPPLVAAAMPASEPDAVKMS